MAQVVGAKNILSAARIDKNRGIFAQSGDRHFRMRLEGTALNRHASNIRRNLPNRRVHQSAGQAFGSVPAEPFVEEHKHIWSGYSPVVRTDNERSEERR